MWMHPILLRKHCPWVSLERILNFSLEVGPCEQFVALICTFGENDRRTLFMITRINDQKHTVFVSSKCREYIDDAKKCKLVLSYLYKMRTVTYVPMTASIMMTSGWKFSISTL